MYDYESHLRVATSLSAPRVVIMNISISNLQCEVKPTKVTSLVIQAQGRHQEDQDEKSSELSHSTGLIGVIRGGEDQGEDACRHRSCKASTPSVSFLPPMDTNAHHPAVVGCK